MTKIKLEDVSFWKQFLFVMKCELKSTHKEMLRDPARTGAILLASSFMLMVTIFIFLPLMYLAVVGSWSSGIIAGIVVTVPISILLYATGVSFRNTYLYSVRHYEATWAQHLRKLDYIKYTQEKVDN